MNWFKTTKKINKCLENLTDRWSAPICYTSPAIKIIYATGLMNKLVAFLVSKKAFQIHLVILIRLLQFVERWLKKSSGRYKTNIFDIFFCLGNQRVRTSKVTRTVCAVYEENATGKKYGTKIVFSFQRGHFDINHFPCSGTPFDFDEDRLYALIRENPRQSTRELSNMMNCDQSTIVRHLHSTKKLI